MAALVKFVPAVYYLEKKFIKKIEARCPLSKVGAELGQALVKVIVGLSATEFRYRVSHNEYNLTCSLISQKPWNGITNIFSTACPLGTVVNVPQDVYSIPDPMYNIPHHMGPTYKLFFTERFR